VQVEGEVDGLREGVGVIVAHPVAVEGVGALKQR
jgi:hypothetical protein